MARSLRIGALAGATALAVVWLPPVPSGAQSDAEEREEVRRRQAEVAAALDVLVATDDELEAAVAVLDAEVVATGAELDDATRAVEAAEREVADARGRVAEIRAHIEALRQEARERAVEAYVHPGGDWLDQVVSSSDSTEAALRTALLADVTGSRADVADQLRASEDDLEAAEDDAEAAQAAADQRRADAEASLAELEAARAAQAELRAGLEARIADFHAEADALAASEADLTARILAASTPAEGGDAADAPASASGLIWPVSGTVTSGFGWRWGKMHQGIDIAAPSGSPVWAANDGTVIFAGWDGGYGQNIVVDHGGGFTTVYAHNSSILVGAGQSVSRGQQIGAVGCTGSCTGPHVHFETRLGGVPYDPIQFLP